jgi:rare lipoprotein A
MNRFYLWSFVVAALLLNACSTGSWNSRAPEKVAATTEELPRSKSGNMPFYEVYGVRYEVMDTSIGYKERGVASWYGKKFHGRSTSSGERYDMHAITAAHKTLPLPTIARVTNLTNGKSIIVRINDRGPFVGNRIIDLSYAAAIEIDMTEAGTALVEVEALTAAKAGDNQSAASAITASEVAGSRMFLQVGAFGEPENARNMATKLNDSGIANAAVHASVNEEPMIYRVRIGPVASVAEYDELVRQAEDLQISGGRLVTESL